MLFAKKSQTREDEQDSSGSSAEDTNSSGSDEEGESGDDDNKEYNKYLSAADDATGEIVVGLLEAGKKMPESDWACVIATPRSYESAVEKMELDNLNDFDELNDIARGSFIVVNEDDAKTVVESMTEHFGKPINIINRFVNPEPTGYRDITAVFESKGAKVEGGKNLEFTVSI